MLNASRHQASGLRRSAATDGTRVLPVLSALPGVGRRTLTLELAHHLALAGEKPLVIDTEAAGAVAASGAVGELELIDLLEGRATFAEAVRAGRAGLCLLAASRGLESLSRSPNPSQAGRSLLDGFAGLASPPGVVLIDAGSGCATQVLTLLDDTCDVLVVLTPDPRAITETYRLLKHLASGSALNAHVLVNRADALAAKRCHANLASALERFAGARVDYAGHVPYDSSLTQVPGRADRRHPQAVAQALKKLAASIGRWPLPAFAAP